MLSQGHERNVKYFVSMCTLCTVVYSESLLVLVGNTVSGSFRHSESHQLCISLVGYEKVLNSNRGYFLCPISGELKVLTNSTED